MIPLENSYISRKHPSRDAIFFGQNQPNIARNYHITDILEPLKQALLASRDVIVSSQIYSSNAQRFLSYQVTDAGCPLYSKLCIGVFSFAFEFHSPILFVREQMMVGHCLPDLPPVVKKSRSPKAGHNKAGRSDFRNQRFEPDTGKMRKMRKVPLTQKTRV